MMIKGRDHKHMCELQHVQPLKSVPKEGIIRITIIFTSSVNYSLSLGLDQGRGALATIYTLPLTRQYRRGGTQGEPTHPESRTSAIITLPHISEHTF